MIESMNSTASTMVLNKQTEVELLINYLQSEAKNIPATIINILTGQYETVINNELSQVHIESLVNNDNFQQALHNIIETENDIHDSWLCVGIASLLSFVQYNWTGPQVDKDIRWLANRKNEAFKKLSLHDECNENVKNPELLYFAKEIFSNKNLQKTFESCIWWLFRANLLHQLILDENSGVIFEEMEELILKISELEILKDLYCKTLFNLEVTQFYFCYRRTQNSEKYLIDAQNIAKLSLSLEGAMGKRTKFQEEEKAQLFLKVAVDKDLFPSRSCQYFPKSLDLNDDLRLEHVEFSEGKERTELGAVEETIILAKYVQLQLSQPKDKLTDEEIKPYLVNVIDNTKCWSLKMTSLSHRCSLESDDKRTVERSMMQAEYLLQELNNLKSPVTERIDVFFASGMKPIWILEQLWANLMLNLGLVKGALDIFIKLKLWEDVILCYNILELKHKAADIIRQEISKKPTVKLWCLLGDATQDITYYEIAWQLSGERSSRAQRHWGMYYFTKKNYDEAIPHLKLSVELNSIQENVWIRLGFAALQVEDWKLAATAYRRYCALEQTTFEAWNNLAKAYIKLGDKSRAWKSLQDAIKCNYDRWEVWDNLMVVSIDLGHFSEVIRCYNRILDLKGQHLDIQILQILANAIINNINDGDGNPSRKLLQRSLELFGRITCCIPNNPDIWRMYALLTALKKTDLDDQKAAQYLQQAHRAAVSNPKWFQAEETTQNVLQLCSNLAKTYLCCTSDSPIAKQRALLGSAKLSLQGVVKKVKDQQWNNQNISENLEKVEEHLKIIVDNLEKIKTSD